MSDTFLTYELSGRGTVLAKPDGPIKESWVGLYITGGIFFVYSLLQLVIAFVVSTRWIDSDIDNWTSGEFTRWVDAQDLLESINEYGAAVGLVWVISLIVWSFRAHTLTTNWTAEARKWKRGWTIGGWFIPIGFFYIPIAVIRETERIALSRAETSSTGGNWRSLKASPLGPTWFVLSWLAIASRRAAASATFDFANLPKSYLFGMTASALMCCSVIVAWIYFGNIGRSIQVGTLSASSSGQSDGLVSVPAAQLGALTSESIGVADQLRKLKDLLDDRILTQDEFDRKKKELLERM